MKTHFTQNRKVDKGLGDDDDVQTNEIKKSFFLCSICDKQFRVEANLRSHFALYHKAGVEKNVQKTDNNVQIMTCNFFLKMLEISLMG